MSRPVPCTIPRVLRGLVLLFGLPACGPDQLPVSPSEPAEDQLWLATGSNHARNPSASDATIDAERAEALALAFINQFGHFHADRLFGEAGRTFDFTELQPAGATALAATGVRAVGPNVRAPLRRAVGSYYLVPMRDALGTVLVVAVSAQADDVGIAASGHVLFPPDAGGEFDVMGFSQLNGSADLISSSSAVSIAESHFGSRVVGPPNLVRRGVGFGPFEVGWELPLAAVGPGKKGPAEVGYIDRRGEVLEHLSLGGPVSYGPHRDRVQIEPLPGRALRSTSFLRGAGAR